MTLIEEVQPISDKDFPSVTLLTAFRQTGKNTFASRLIDNKIRFEKLKSSNSTDVEWWVYTKVEDQDLIQYFHSDHQTHYEGIALAWLLKHIVMFSMLKLPCSNENMFIDWIARARADASMILMPIWYLIIVLILESIMLFLTPMSWTIGFLVLAISLAIFVRNELFYAWYVLHVDRRMIIQAFKNIWQYQIWLNHADQFVAHNDQTQDEAIDELFKEGLYFVTHPRKLISELCLEDCLPPGYEHPYIKDVLGKIRNVASASIVDDNGYYNLRDLFIILGTFAREIDPEFWAKSLALTMMVGNVCNTSNHYLVTDYRYKNEKTAIEQTTGNSKVVTLRLYRKSVPLPPQTHIDPTKDSEYSMMNSPCDILLVPTIADFTSACNLMPCYSEYKRSACFVSDEPLREESHKKDT